MPNWRFNADNNATHYCRLTWALAIRIKNHAMPKLTLLLTISAALMALIGCAAVNPNNNVGLRTTDDLIQQGSCAEALDLAKWHADRGEPWAEWRMAMIVIDQRCPQLMPKSFEEPVKWLRKAACYESKTAWEKGDGLSLGPTGFYNTRSSSTNAAVSLATLFSRQVSSAEGLYFINRVASQYEPSSSEYKQLASMKSNIEKKLTPSEIAESANKQYCEAQK
jgi:hypothetical protein